LSALYPDTKKITPKELFKLIDWCTVQYTEQYSPQCPEGMMYNSQVLYQIKVNGVGNNNYNKFQAGPFIRRYFFKVLRNLRRANGKNKKKLYLYAFSDDLIASIYHALKIIPSSSQYRKQ